MGLCGRPCGGCCIVLWIWPSVFKYFTMQYVQVSAYSCKLHIVIRNACTLCFSLRGHWSSRKPLLTNPLYHFTLHHYDFKNIWSSIKYFTWISFRSPQKYSCAVNSTSPSSAAFRFTQASSLVRLWWCVSGIQELEKSPNWNWSIPPW